MFCGIVTYRAKQIFTQGFMLGYLKEVVRLIRELPVSEIKLVSESYCTLQCLKRPQLRRVKRETPCECARCMELKRKAGFCVCYRNP